MISGILSIGGRCTRICVHKFEQLRMTKCIYLEVHVHVLIVVQDLGEERVIVSPSIGVQTGRGCSAGDPCWGYWVE
jgi:hypothetical protein